MILDEIVLHNFGVFAGKQTVRLTPPKAEKPITLVGGLNGNGKTTILEAIQLALYGKLASQTRQNGAGYNEYLAKAISRNVDPRDGAVVQVAFRSTVDGVPKKFRVCRSWCVQSDKISEKLDVFVDVEGTAAEEVHTSCPDRLGRV